MPRKPREVKVIECNHEWRLCQPKFSVILEKSVPPFRECLLCFELDIDANEMYKYGHML